jgi:hypothetical protein
MKSRSAESRSTAARPTPTPMPAFAPVLRPAVAGKADAAGVSVIVADGASGEEEVVFLLMFVLMLADDADVVVDLLVTVAVGELAAAASMENRGDDISSSPSQLPPKGIKRSTKSFVSFTSSAGISMVQVYWCLSLMLIPPVNLVRRQITTGAGTHLLARLRFQLRVLYGCTHRSTLAVSQLAQYSGNADARSAVQAMSYLLPLTTVSSHLGWSQ